MFSKLFSRITESSLMEEPLEVRYTFMMLLAISDHTGHVIGTDVAIARRINMPLESFMQSIAALNLPDGNSNSKEMDGRRVVRSEGERGYFIVNYSKYRDMRTEDDRRNYMRKYMDSYRMGKKSDKPVNTCKQSVNTCKQPLTLLTHTDTDTDTESDKRERESQKALTPSKEVCRRPASIAEVVAHAQMIGMPEAEAVSWHRDQEATGWARADGRPYDNWRKEMVFERDRRRSQPNGINRNISRTEQVAADRNRFISDTRTDEQKAADDAAFQARQDAWLASP